MGRFVEEENVDAVREAKVLHTSSCANHSDEPLRAKIVFSNGQWLPRFLCFISIAQNRGVQDFRFPYGCALAGCTDLRFVNFHYVVFRKFMKKTML